MMNISQFGYLNAPLVECTHFIKTIRRHLGIKGSVGVRVDA